MSAPKSSALTPEELALFGPAPVPATPAPAVDDDPFADVAPAAALIPEHAAAVLPPDAPASSAATPLPEKAKRGRKPKAFTLIDVQPGESEAEALARSATPAPAPAVTSAAVMDGPGWVDVVCKCGHNFGKRPPGSSIDSSLCPNKGAHRPAWDPASGRDAAAPVPSQSLLVLEPGNALTIELGPKTIAALAELFKR